jgi:hypothetical protein
MQTQSIVQSSANVIRIVSLRVGDIYKRYSESSYDSSCFYGIVKSIDNNGQQTFIHAIEYKKSYNSMEASMYIMRGDKDVSIFPTTLEEFKNEFKSVLDSTSNEIEKLEKQIKDKQILLVDTQNLIDGTFLTELQTPEYREMSQSDFNLKLQAKNESINF